MSILIVIPARYGSTRFPGKVLALLEGRPLIEHVYRACLGSTLADRVVVATDHERVREAVEGFGGEVVMTSSEHASGTDRVAEVAKGMDYDIIVNVQGDEPLIKAEMIDSVAGLLIDDTSADMGTLVKRIVSSEDYLNPNVVKAVLDRQGYALYFSRAPIPFFRDSVKLHTDSKPSVSGEINNRVCYKHIGIYSYRKRVLLELAGLPACAIEEAEKLEQLRALYNGYRIKAAETSFETIGVDTPEDLERVKKWLSLSS
ncbi:MAG: 3-deoxy-manno-octulosonate cytidylyltransferase [Nitrospirae bacterium]|nr:MAG: 3-deoxy-manno-octulosonate cytidylyltransferase [Nitrospirota bacterium]